MKQIPKTDFIMGMYFAIIIIADYYFKAYHNIETFTIWHLLIISSGYGGYITLRLFTWFIRARAKRIGMEYELDKILSLKKRDKLQ